MIARAEPLVILFPKSLESDPHRIRVSLLFDRINTVGDAAIRTFVQGAHTKMREVNEALDEGMRPTAAPGRLKAQVQADMGSQHHTALWECADGPECRAFYAKHREAKVLEDCFSSQGFKTLLGGCLQLNVNVFEECCREFGTTVGRAKYRFVANMRRPNINEH